MKNLKRVIVLCTLVLVVTLVGNSQEVNAAAKKTTKQKEWKITKVFESAGDARANKYPELGEWGWYHEFDTQDKFKPTCKKNKDGSYTLTLYDGTWSYLETNLRWGEDVNKWVFKSGKDVKVSYNAHDIRVYVNANAIRGKAGKSVTRTIYAQPTVVGDNGKTVKKGKKIKIKIVIKHDQKVISELKKIIKNEIKYDKDTFSDFDRAFTAYTWVFKNIKDCESDCLLSETLKKRKGN